MSTALIVPVLKNFKGFTELVHSIDTEIIPMVIDNWNGNRGVGPAWNLGLKYCLERGIDYAVVCNDDVKLSPGIIPRLTSRLVGGTLLASPMNITGVCHPRGLNFWCYAVRPAEFVETVGFFDENFAPAYFEDDDMAYRIELSGRRRVNIEEFVYHQVQGTQDMDPVPVVSRDIWDRNEAYYQRKWGGPGGAEQYRNPFGNLSMSLKDW